MGKCLRRESGEGEIMKKCAKCGFEMKDNETICRICGERMPGNPYSMGNSKYIQSDYPHMQSSNMLDTGYPERIQNGEVPQYAADGHLEALGKYSNKKQSDMNEQITKRGALTMVAAICCLFGTFLSLMDQYSINPLGLSLWALSADLGGQGGFHAMSRIFAIFFPVVHIALIVISFWDYNSPSKIKREIKESILVIYIFFFLGMIDELSYYCYYDEFSDLSAGAALLFIGWLLSLFSCTTLRKKK